MRNCNTHNCVCSEEREGCRHGLSYADLCANQLMSSTDALYRYISVVVVAVVVVAVSIETGML